jgi:hypothetical protein
MKARDKRKQSILISKMEVQEPSNEDVWNCSKCLLIESDYIRRPVMDNCALNCNYWSALHLCSCKIKPQTIQDRGSLIAATLYLFQSECKKQESASSIVILSDSFTLSSSTAVLSDSLHNSFVLGLELEHSAPLSCTCKVQETTLTRSLSTITYLSPF